MTLGRRAQITAIVLALPAALAVTAGIDWLRARDTRLVLGRFVDALQTDVVRDACTNDPNWFLAGPRTGRPSMAERNIPDADVHLPRPSADPLPIDVFAYDASFQGLSTASPRFPNALRDPMRRTPPEPRTFGSYSSPAGTGMQVAQLTGWAGPCAVLLVRMQPRPGLWWGRLGTFAVLSLLFVAVALAATMPTVARVRRLSVQAGASARGKWETIAPDAGKDEVSAMAFVLNDAATEIHRREAEVADRVEALRRIVSALSSDVASPFANLEASLAALAHLPVAADAQPKVRASVEQAHQLASRLRNLLAATELRIQNDPLPVMPHDLAAVVRAALDRIQPLATFAGIALQASIPGAPLIVALDPAYAPIAIGNILENAVRYNTAGGRIDVILEPRNTEVFSLVISSRGRDVSDEEFKGLTAIRRFRGDEGWNRRPNAPGLGIAVAREIADRSGWKLEMRRPAGGGFDVEFNGGLQPKRT
ncbi:MAG TPA: HAMP domain-containing sensor histidine kinase [Vicinamibacterales bacterium]|nr:HAMP domain-containing sensor histidine kinase [Vicinamibacterales bacterium]